MFSIRAGISFASKLLKIRIKCGDFVKMREKRTEAGMMQREAAQKLGIAQNTLSQLETGTNKVKADMLPKLARLYGCSIEDLFEPEELQSGCDGK